MSELTLIGNSTIDKRIKDSSKKGYKSKINPMRGFFLDDKHTDRLRYLDRNVDNDEDDLKIPLPLNIISQRG